MDAEPSPGITESISLIDQDFEALKEEKSIIRALNPRLEAEILALESRTKSSYSETLKEAVLGKGNEATAALSELRNRLREARIRILSETVQDSTERIEKTIASPFWLGEQSTYLEDLDRIREKARNTSGSDPQRILRQLTSCLGDIAHIRRQLDSDERRIRVRLPIQIILWGLPIIIGLWVSGKLSPGHKLLALGLLLAVALGSYISVRFRLFSRISGLRRLREVISRSPYRALTLIQVPVVIALLMVLAGSPIDAFLIEHRMDLSLGPLQQPIARGSHVSVPYRVYYGSPTPALDVQLIFEAPGMDPALSETRLHAQTNSGAETGAFDVSVPGDLPPGLYTMRLRADFTAGRILHLPNVPLTEMYCLKQTEIQVNVD